MFSRDGSGFYRPCRCAVHPLPRPFFASRHALAALVLTTAVAGAIAACGRVDSAPTASSGDSGAAGADATTNPPLPSGDGAPWVEPPWDAFAVDAEVPPDAGPPPVLACAVDAAMPCPFLPSVCIDDRWLRFYTSGVCDGGTCVYQSGEYLCPASPVKPDCMDGGCRIIVLR